MKNTIIILVLVALIAAAFFIGRSSADKSSEISDYKKKITNLDEDLKSKDELLKVQAAIIERQTASYDSLEAVKQKVIVQTIAETNRIDEVIEGDSAKAIAEYRSSLVALGWLPDIADLLTYREIGIGAKEMRQRKGMQLQLNYCEEQQDTLNAIISTWRNKYDIMGAKYDLAEMKFLEADGLLEITLEKTENFFYHRWGIYGGVGMSYSASGKLEPSLQVGVGVFIWRNE